jgi:hypothetical protein
MIDLSGNVMREHTVFELRRYRLRPGTRETLIALFDREFIEPQEVLGMRVEGEFRDAGDPDAFVWVRSFSDMDDRTEALRSFYTGPVWRQHGAAAKATMVNSDNVLLLKPAGAITPFAHNTGREQETVRGPASGLVIANTCSLAPHTEEEFAAFFNANALPLMQKAGARIDAVFTTERSANGFPQLPVREGETVLVWFECHEDEHANAAYQERLRQNPDWTTEIYPRLDSLCWRRIETTRLTPTARSLCAWR